MNLIKKIFSGMLCVVGAMLSSCRYSAEMDAVKGIKKITDGVFFLEFEGDYGMERYIAQGGARNIEEMTAFISKELKQGKWTAPENPSMKDVKICPVDFGCSSIAVRTSDGKSLFGRNYDWKNCSVLIIHSKPNAGYESVSTCCLAHIGLEADWKPSGNIFSDMVALAAIYVPMDGMNEKGLYIADLIVGGENEEPTAQDRGNVNVTTTDAIRMVLDKAADVDEAVALLETLDMHSVIGRGHHFAIADAAGKAVAVEWVDNKMFVKETKVLTNHYVTDSRKKDDGKNPDTENSRQRFALLGDAALEKKTALDVAQTLKSVCVANYRKPEDDDLTVWSAVFEPENQKITYFFREDYDNKFTFELK